jgi:hypothetical protein
MPSLCPVPTKPVAAALPSRLSLHPPPSLHSPRTLHSLLTQNAGTFLLLLPVQQQHCRTGKVAAALPLWLAGWLGASRLVLRCVLCPHSAPCAVLTYFYQVLLQQQRQLARAIMTDTPWKTPPSNACHAPHASHGPCNQVPHRVS